MVVFVKHMRSGFDPGLRFGGSESSPSLADSVAAADPEAAARTARRAGGFFQPVPAWSARAAGPVLPATQSLSFRKM